MLKYKILAVNGEIGRAEDFYFDERFKTIRYLVVNTGGFLFKKLVLISPIFIDEIYYDEKLIKVSLTKDEIENSPDVDTEKPVSRLYETDLNRYYGTAPYWSGFLAWGPVPVAIGLRPGEEVPASLGEPEHDERKHYLRSVNEVFGYTCETSDGRKGVIRDFKINPHTWRIETFIMTMSRLSSGDEIEFDVNWIDRISFPDRSIRLGINIKELEHMTM